MGGTTTYPWVASRSSGIEQVREPAKYKKRRGGLCGSMSRTVSGSSMVPVASMMVLCSLAAKMANNVGNIDEKKYMTVATHAVVL
jgi:hypothetical protein